MSRAVGPSHLVVAPCLNTSMVLDRRSVQY